MLKSVINRPGACRIKYMMSPVFLEAQLKYIIVNIVKLHDQMQSLIFYRLYYQFNSPIIYHIS